MIISHNLPQIFGNFFELKTGGSYAHIHASTSDLIINMEPYLVRIVKRNTKLKRILNFIIDWFWLIVYEDIKY